MHVLLFYAEPNPEHLDEWMNYTATMQRLLESNPDFVELHYMRMVDPKNPNGFVAAYFRTKEAMEEWARHPLHREAMDAANDHIFLDYRLECAEIYRAYSKEDHVPGNGTKTYVQMITEKSREASSPQVKSIPFMTP